MGKDNPFKINKIIASSDCAYSKDGQIQVCAGIVSVAPKWEILEFSITKKREPVEYIPGKFYLREGDITIETISKLKKKFDFLMVHGHGKGNPKGKGLACYVGKNLRIPTVGIAENLLLGTYENLKREKGSIAPVLYENKIIAYALRTKENLKPLFVSEGFDFKIENFLKDILSSCIYRIPEPLRLAHSLAKKYLII